MSEAAHHITGGQAGKPAPGRRPVILQVLPSLVTGGAERGAVDVAIALSQAGAVPLVASAGGPMVRELERHGVRHVTLPLKAKNPVAMLRNARKLEALIRDEGVDIVHARSRAPAWSAWLAARRASVPFMTTFHAPYNFKGELKRRYNSVMALGERVIAISEFIRDHILANYAVDPGRIRLIHRGIDLGHFSPERVGRERLVTLSRSWRIPDDRHVIMLPGRLTRWKGQAVLIEALALLERRDFYCLLVGADQGRTGYRKELEELAAARGLRDLVHLADHCDDMAAAYLLSDVVVSASSDPEAFGRVIVEAQAMGRPVIVTNHGAVRETVLAGETGWVVPPGDPQALAEALSLALSMTPEERAAVAERAIAFVGERFSRERMCAETLGVYAELLDERRAAAPRFA
ncbi:glycosyltransferase family 4 protein [Arenibaculum pallidiluteum]|uniref:glycosyltransferase family 4 protein n=1 Tax=Arenibaculum pallidiluteum TaxID=2812559 RepID=UPI001A96341E|nr:glycosyltransferase family 4 protein [Arenibaculum pallidiluteum]